MLPIKAQILSHHCYTKLVYDRINKKLRQHLSYEEIERLLLQILQEVQEEDIRKRGKNYYVTNHSKGIRLTIHSGTFRIITVDRI